MRKLENWGASPVPFIPGLQLSELFYEEVVCPLLGRHFPDMEHSAALLGYGSDVLGYDTPLSRDHMWGPRLVLFLHEEGYLARKLAIHDMLRHTLPLEFYGYPTHFEIPDHEGVRVMKSMKHGPVEHMVCIYTLAEFFKHELGWNAFAEPGSRDWLSLPEQRLLELTAGKVFHDDLGLEEVRARFAYYPNDVWLYLLASQWMRISQEEPFTGRTGDLGDEIGSRILAARLAEAVMRLAFLLERRYAPYSKWFGTAFNKLSIAAELEPILEAVFQACTWQERQANLARAYTVVARKQNSLGLIESLSEEITNFHERPYQVIHADRFAAALQRQIQAEALRKLPLYGSVNQLSNSVDVLSDREAVYRMQRFYEG